MSLKRTNTKGINDKYTYLRYSVLRNIRIYSSAT
jgi:hypothetical protein